VNTEENISPSHDFLGNSIEDHLFSKVLEPLPRGHFHKLGAKGSERKKGMRTTQEDRKEIISFSHPL
jgi:hypothetical protein